MSSKYRPPAVLAMFLDPERLLAAIKAVREQGYRGIDAYTPYPVHGLSEALGLKISWMPRVTKTAFFVGAGLGFTFEAWTMAWAWPLNIAGKPYISVPAYMPVTFESGILIAGISTFIAVLIAGRLRPAPNFQNLDDSLTNDRFGLYVPVRPYEQANVQELLTSLGAEEVRNLA
ncbi:MAG TPA: DUF3341 domain-containing protein [Terriglobales bacterium]|nr:DUF3341 domain-containing protein [Terriglobales bacterium]